MKPLRQIARQQSEDLGGSYASNTAEHVADDENEILLNGAADMYPEPPAEVPLRKHSHRHLGTRLKVKQLAEARLLQISEQLSKLADEVRYLNPLLAEAIDDAWEATDTAIELLEGEG